MKLTKRLTQKELKNISKVKITESNSHKNGKSEIYKEVLIIKKDKILSEGVIYYKFEGKTVNTVKEKGEYKNLALGLRRINRAIKLQNEENAANKCTVTCELA